MDQFSDPKGKAIRRQGLTGFLLLILGAGIAFLLGQGQSADALSEDPSPMMPGLVVAGVGMLLLFTARIRLVFHRPKSLIEDGVQGALSRILKSIID